MQNKLEKYLSQIERHLTELPVKECEAELREIRSHLEMMIKENIACGYDSNNAVEKALEQFGSAERVGLDLRFGPNSVSKRWRALLVKTMAFNTIVLFATLILWSLYSSGYIAPGTALLAWFSYGSSGMITFAAGWFCGSRARGQLTGLSFILWMVMTCDVVVSGHILALAPVQYLSPAFNIFTLFAGMWTCRWLSNRRDRSNNKLVSAPR
jgi:hypothetical protein